MLLMSLLFITDLSALSASSRAPPSLQLANAESRGEMTDKHQPQTHLQVQNHLLPTPRACGGSIKQVIPIHFSSVVH